MMRDTRKILCCGVCVLDIIHIVTDYPKEDSDIRSKYGRWQRGGNAANNCTVLKNLGAECEFLGTFTDAEMFKFVIQDMRDRAICIDNCVFHADCAVPVSTILLNETTNSRTIIATNSNLPYLEFEDFDKCDLNQYDWVHFEARNFIDTAKMIEKVKNYNKSNKRKITTSLDLEKVKWDNMELAPMVDYVFMGRDCAEALNCNSMKEAVYKLNENLKTKNTIICPWGSTGVAVLTPSEYFECASYPPEKVVDTLGAGDTFAGAAMYALSCGNNINISIEFASRVAGTKIAAHGYDNIRDISDKLKEMLVYRN